jgi:hypothetical protein|tara:strand:+ start:534 stop:800 length:267 start_codon:yes stop_codon:yes gene_type:complete
MIKNILSVLIFLFSLFFFYLVGSIYFSDHHEKKVKKNREIIFKKIKNNISELPILVNDTNNVIEFNSGFETENMKIKRSFWKLFKKND